MKRYVKANIISLEDEGVNGRISIASDPATRPETLDRLMALTEDLDAERLDVWRSISLNPNTSAKTLDYMARSRRILNAYAILINIAANPNTSAETLEYLSRLRYRDGILIQVALNPNTSIPVLRDLAKHSDAYVRWAVRQNPKTPQSLRDHIPQVTTGTEVYIWYNIGTATVQDVKDCICDVFKNAGFPLRNVYDEDIDEGVDDFDHVFSARCDLILGVADSARLDREVHDRLRRLGVKDISYSDDDEYDLDED